MPICEKCKSSVLHDNIEKHHIIPIAIIKAMKYYFNPTVSNKMWVCSHCHEEIHRLFKPHKFWWKKLGDKTLKIKGSEKLNRLIEEIKQMQMEI
ncbi:MAG: HNH endonuclease [Proteobacteria bacterium]|nr:HNH endonuclease [Pseudomonadota bacterium]